MKQCNTIVILDRKPSAGLALGASDRGSLGFTLIEMVVYVALAALIITGAANVKWSIVKNGVSAEAHMEVLYNARFVMDKIGSFVRNASSLEEADSVFLTNPGVLVVTSAESGQKVTIDTYMQTVSMGGSSADITTLRMKEGSGAYVDLTSADVTVSNFYLEKVFRAGKMENINIALTLDSVNPGGDSARNASLAIETSLSFRQ